MASFSIFPLAPQGLGFGNPDAKISTVGQRTAGTITAATMQTGSHLLLASDFMVDVQHYDSGCIDGRTTAQVMFRNAEAQLVTHEYDYDDHHWRPLVAGGGYITARPAEVVLRGRGHTPQDDLKRVIKQLQKAGVYAGAHTGSGADEAQGVTDCGANDKFSAIVAAALEYQDAIKSGLQLLFEVTGRSLENFDDHYAKALQAYEQMAQPAYSEASNGQMALQLITDSLKADATGKPLAVIKQSEGDHRERFIYMNAIPNTTLDQTGFTRALAEYFPDQNPVELPQVFVVDMWYIDTLATALTINLQQRKLAFITMMIYQLATAATLTDGSLPVYVAKDNG
jgi:hypothetical protein